MTEKRLGSAVHTLVIACGNPLRGDDGVGPAAAHIVKAWQIPATNVLAVHQLVPELIDEMKGVQRVLFVDAGMDISNDFKTGVIAPKKSRRFFGHYETPANLLALMHELEGRAPDAWQVSISARSFNHGDEMSRTAQDHLHAALVWIRDFLAEPPCTKSV